MGLTNHGNDILSTETLSRDIPSRQRDTYPLPTTKLNHDGPPEKSHCKFNYLRKKEGLD